MKKIIIPLALLMLVLLFYLIFNSAVSYDPSKAETTGIEEIALFFEMCRDPNADPLTVYLCTSISDADFYKLQIIKNIKGNKLCSLENEVEKCSIENYAKKRKTLWEFEYQPAFEGKIASYTITFVESKENYFFIREGFTKDNVIYKRDIFIIEPLNKEAIDILIS